MIERKIYRQLLAWKNDPHHKPLLIKGQRQVGKSYIIDYFAKQEYKDCIFLDMHDDPAT
ncbi:MAG: AAA family ATPase, partial [Candidatus Methanomethylophilaceae archaeon]|nr:AAA family ATPase [Candidatus Methanomethylophilaceae archaeon]